MATNIITACYWCANSSAHPHARIIGLKEFEIALIFRAGITCAVFLLFCWTKGNALVRMLLNALGEMAKILDDFDGLLCVSQDFSSVCLSIRVAAPLSLSAVQVASPQSQQGCRLSGGRISE